MLIPLPIQRTTNPCNFKSFSLCLLKLMQASLFWRHVVDHKRPNSRRTFPSDHAKMLQTGEKIPPPTTKYLHVEITSLSQ